MQKISNAMPDAMFSDDGVAMVAPIPKQSVLVGECTYVEFDWLEKLLKE